MQKQEKIAHDDLSKLAAKWLKRAHSSNGAGCNLSLVEVGGLFGGEIADAWGYRWGFAGGSIVVESKVSRSDFLADRKKPHRNGAVLGMGNYRYYICPEGLIQPEDLPEKWGLIWVNKRKHIKIKVGHLLSDRDYRDDKWEEWWHESDTNAELQLMAHLLARLGDPDEMNGRYRRAMSESVRAHDAMQKMRRELKEMSREKWKLQSRLSKLTPEW
jgi:hypothetical protein